MNKNALRRATALTVSTVILASLTVATVAAPLVAKADKTTVCHKPGTQAEKTLKVAARAAEAHLAHGDYRRRCGHNAASTYLNRDALDATYPSHGPVTLDVVGDELMRFVVPGDCSPGNAFSLYATSWIWADGTEVPLGLIGTARCFVEPQGMFASLNAPAEGTFVDLKWASDSGQPLTWEVSILQ